MKKDWKWFLTIFLPRLPLFFIFLPFVILMRGLRPILWIRFFPICLRIGHAAGNVDVYLLERKLESKKPRVVEIFVPRHPTKVNRQILKLWSRVVPVSTLAHWVYWVNMEIPGGEAHYHEGRGHQSRDIFLLTYKTPPQISFTPLEEERGEALLQSMGIPKGAPFICFHGRDSLYLNQFIPGADWIYHNYRDFSIGNFVLSAEELVQRGYYVIRMGRLVKEKFPLIHPQVIDYANSPFRSDFADIFLISKCYFFVGQSGIESVARLFRKPVVYINFIPVGLLHTWSESFLSIFKLLRNKKENRFLNFREMLHVDIRGASDTKEYEDRGLEVIENSSEDIRDVILEMEGRLKGQWKPTDEQEKLQSQFWEMYPLDASFHGINKSRVGALFLEKHKDLL